MNNVLDISFKALKTHVPKTATVEQLRVPGVLHERGPPHVGGHGAAEEGRL